MKIMIISVLMVSLTFILVLSESTEDQQVLQRQQSQAQQQSQPQSEVYKQQQTITGGNSNSFSQNSGISEVRNKNAFGSGDERIARFLFAPVLPKSMTKFFESNLNSNH
jgi:hypothetical protein